MPDHIGYIVNWTKRRPFHFSNNSAKKRQIFIDIHTPEDIRNHIIVIVSHLIWTVSLQHFVESESRMLWEFQYVSQ